MKIGLIEDNDFIRKNYEDFFTKFLDFNIIFSVGDWKNLFQVKSNLLPDIILLDLMLPSGNSIHYIHKIKQMFPYAKIIILSAVSDPQIAKAAFSTGAVGFLLKSSSLDFIKESLMKTHDGGTAVSPIIATYLIDQKSQNIASKLTIKLSKRETELVKLAVTGMSNKMIASAMNVTFFTINQHLKSIYKKLNINSKAELIALLVGANFD